MAWSNKEDVERLKLRSAQIQAQVSVLLFLWFFNISMNYTLKEYVFVGKRQIHY